MLKYPHWPINTHSYLHTHISPYIRTLVHIYTHADTAYSIVSVMRFLFIFGYNFKFSFKFTFH